MRARNKAGLGGMPWALTRRAIAERWHVPPPDVDEYPAQEIALELHLMSLEAEGARRG